MQKWEYQAVPMVLANIGPKQIREELSKWGADGWELISTVTTSMGEMFLMKRPVAEKSAPVFEADFGKA
jgi:hypothetical protein